VVFAAVGVGVVVVVVVVVAVAVAVAVGVAVAVAVAAAAAALADVTGAPDSAALAVADADAVEAALAERAGPSPLDAAAVADDAGEDIGGGVIAGESEDLPNRVSRNTTTPAAAAAMTTRVTTRPDMLFLGEGGASDAGAGRLGTGRTETRSRGGVETGGARLVWGGCEAGFFSGSRAGAGAISARRAMAFAVSS
jgi:hypothetical protein